jgi:hypothetical protein
MLAGLYLHQEILVFVVQFDGYFCYLDFVSIGVYDILQILLIFVI